MSLDTEKQSTTCTLSQVPPRTALRNEVDRAHFASQTSRAQTFHSLLESVSVHLPGEPEYERSRTPWNTAVDVHPAAVAEPTGPQQVSEVVRAAKYCGLRIAPQSTGHNAGPLVQHDLSDTVLVLTSSMNQVTIDPFTATVRAEGGALWDDVIESAGHHGLSCLHGSAPDVGVAGYCLGGGIFIYARRLGMATNSVTAVEVVLADGSLIRADKAHHRSLFWALRGGGGSFGIVTALEFSAYPLSSVYAGMMVWDVDDADKVLRRWAQWAPDAPDEVTTTLRILNLPDRPGLPKAVRGRRVICLDGAIIGARANEYQALSPFRELRPEADTFDWVPPWTLSRLHMDPEGPTPVAGDSALLGSLPDGAIDAFLAQVGPGTTSSLLSAELRQLGGALARPHPGGGAMNMMPGQFLVFGAAMADTPDSAARGRADAHALIDSLRPWSTGMHYLNFVEGPIDPRHSFAEETWASLTRVKRAYDPTDLFVSNHPVPPATV